MLLAYPVGIPCLYFVLVWKTRHALNPDALFVVVDVTCDGKLTTDAVPVTYEMRQLAKSVTLIHGAAADIREKAIACHENKIAEQTESRREDSQSAQLTASQEARRSSLLWESSIVHDAVAARAAKMRDRHFVPDKWTDYLPEDAAVVDHLEASAAVIETELVRQYRNANPSAQLLSFLSGAYKVCGHQCTDCIDRLSNDTQEPLARVAAPSSAALLLLGEH